ncbi:HAD family hydrolase [Cognatishimia activa]|uniref:phosphoglycolate phosphatase n=1 Tax=Cognatishimia activa TaxID=1715691 RepID=A0A0P1J658_9RHOB|nr:HAD family hydrolase [Cognatishimia activa]CUI90158.1 Pyrophosphatase PpaX [Cognatishimia activa]CUK25692.1 Pyrophosphatase PpaX [Cognatishimia activa]
MQVQGLLFDKDGTLFDFNETWSNWTVGIIDHFAEGSAELAAHIATTIQFNLSERVFLPSSPIIAGTNREAAELVASALADADVDYVETYLAQAAAKAPLAPVVPLGPLLTEFRSQGLKLGVMTNDTERGARAHLSEANALELFDFVAGHDSGFGAKPDPDPLLAFAQKQELDPRNVVMVGDSTHDLIAGRRAGMMTIGVLTGPAKEEELAHYADYILPHIGHLPNWLGRG